VYGHDFRRTTEGVVGVRHDRERLAGEAVPLVARGLKRPPSNKARLFATERYARSALPGGDRRRSRCRDEHRYLKSAPVRIIAIVKGGSHAERRRRRSLFSAMTRTSRALAAWPPTIASRSSPRSSGAPL
jgi:hypothetical protein